MLDRNLQAGRANKTAITDRAGTWTYGQLADRVDASPPRSARSGRAASSAC